jgi:hypothetical protein
MPGFPIERYLTPEPQLLVPEGFESVSPPITSGLPFTFDLSGGFQAILLLPNGVAKDWVNIDPAAIVSEGADEQVLQSPAAGPLSLDARAPLRLMLRKAGVVLGSVAVSLGAHSLVDDSGRPDRGVQLELVVLDWRICAGSIRGPGNYGSYITVAWRIANRAIDLFGPPPISERVYRRMPTHERIQSHVGHKKYARNVHDRRSRRKAR